MTTDVNTVLKANNVKNRSACMAYCKLYGKEPAEGHLGLATRSRTHFIIFIVFYWPRFYIVQYYHI